LGEVAYTYGPRGLHLTETRIFTLDTLAQLDVTKAVNREYNALDELTRSTWDDGQMWSIAYDGRGLVETVRWYDPAAENWQNVADYERSLAGLPLARGSSYGQTRTFTYDSLGRPLTDVVTVNDSPLADRSYTYNDSGDLVGVEGQTNGVSAAATYTYDAQHRLLSASGPNGYTGAFTYSAAGNVQTAEVSWNGSAENRHVRYEYGAVDPHAVDQLINVPGNGVFGRFRYDLAGNMTERLTHNDNLQMTWDGLDQLRVVRSVNGSEVYLYDHTGSRVLALSEQDGVRLWFGETETHYDLAGNQTKRYLRLAAGGPTLARVTNGTDVELQYADALQNLMFALDTEGNVTASFLYGPFGEVVYKEGADDHRRQFNGKENDAMSGLRYYGFRYYDPLTLRWNAADPLYRFKPERGLTDPQRMNLYSFSLNNPLRYYDPDGREPGGWGYCGLCYEKNKDNRSSQQRRLDRIERMETTLSTLKIATAAPRAFVLGMVKVATWPIPDPETGEYTITQDILDIAAAPSNLSGVGALITTGVEALKEAGVPEAQANLIGLVASMAQRNPSAYKNFRNAIKSGDTKKARRILLEHVKDSAVEGANIADNAQKLQNEEESKKEENEVTCSGTIWNWQCSDDTGGDDEEDQETAQ
jgi:RHS repeat-associated protein